MAKMNYQNAKTRNTFQENRFNAKLDDICIKGEKEFSRQYNARQKNIHKNEAEMKETNCNKCGSDHIVATIGSGPHAYRWRCGSCDAFIKWTSNPLSEDILEKPKPVQDKHKL